MRDDGQRGESRDVDGRSLVFVYRLHDTDDMRRFRLRGLAADREYRVTTADEADCGVFSGAALMNDGVSVSLRNQNSAEVLIVSPLE